MWRVLFFCMLLTPALSHGAATASRQIPQTLETESGRLYGSLTLPTAEKPVPVVLIIAGSGPTDRDGNNPEGGHNDAYKKLAQALVRHGIASLRYDKRGVAASRAAAPDERELTVAAYVRDAQGWLKQLRDDPRLGPVFLLGHSEGALIATLAAQAGGVDGLITLAGPGIPVGQLLDMQLAARLPPDLLRQSRHILAKLMRGTPDPEVPQALEVVLRPSVQPYLISLVSIDPAQSLAQLEVPTLIVQGTHDAQVPPLNAAMLHTARPDSQVAVIDGMNHVLRITPQAWDAQRDSYNDPTLPLARDLIDAILMFIDSSYRPVSR